ncbi:MAG: hypothetical protein PHI63_04810 [Patescibacteria group bacterium]|nr:hypothetical protein [Patescibacteria group bacterium]
MEETLSLIISILTLGAFIFAAYKFFRDPDIRNRQDLDLMKQACDMRHSNIDNTILSIKENHLRHLETDVIDINKNITKIFTILEERLPPKTRG